MKSLVGWWKAKGLIYDPESASADEVAQFATVHDLFSNWKLDSSPLSTTSIGEALSWWVRNQKGRGFDVDLYKGEDLEKVRPVTDALQQWQAKGATQPSDSFLPDLVAFNAKEISAALARWDKIKDIPEEDWTPDDRFIALRIKKLFDTFPDKTEDNDIMIFMRKPEAVKMLQDTLDGSKTRMIDMPKLTDPDSRNRLTNWRRSKSFDDVGIIDEVAALVKDVLAVFSQWNGKGGRSPRSCCDEIESASAYSRQVAEALSWLDSARTIE
jgi:hypothetical protein